MVLSLLKLWMRRMGRKGVIMIRQVRGVIKDTKGMTLTELLIGLFVFSIIAASVITMLVSSLGAYIRVRDYSEVNTLMDNLSELVMLDVMSATPFPDEFPPPLPQPGDVFTIFTTHYVVYSVHPANPPYDTREILMRNGRPVLAAGFYRSISLDSVKLSDEDDEDVPLLKDPIGQVKLTLTLSPGGGMPQTRDYITKPVGLQ